MNHNQITEHIIGAAIKVHAQIGPGLLESVYEKCLAIELAKTGVRFQTQVAVYVRYDGVKVGEPFYIDLLVERLVVVEIKAVERLHPVHTAQLISYLRFAQCQVGLLINFHSYSIKSGLKRIVLGYRGPAPRFPRL